MISSDMEPVEIAALVCEELSVSGIKAVLTGGTCVSVWTRNEFASLDFIALGLHSNKKIAHALESIGFTRSTRNPRYFEHPDTDLALEFPPGPLMVGDEHISDQSIDEYATDLGVLRLLSPTDCVKDRLAGYYYFRDEQNLRQAIAVAREHPIDWKDLERWHSAEGQVDGFRAFESAVNGEKS
tara:strand:+ start:493 stop:1041 length:549 start_codon:yes stop_codon:yes gene_type:complete